MMTAAVFAWLTVSGVAGAVEPVTYEDSQGNVISFQLGDSALADSVAVQKDFSQERAEAVRRYLVEELELTQIDLSVRGAGEGQPVATNNTPEGRQRNRRVEFIF